MAESDDQYDAWGAICARARPIPTGLAERATSLPAVGDLPDGSVARRPAVTPDDDRGAEFRGSPGFAVLTAARAAS